MKAAIFRNPGEIVMRPDTPYPDVAANEVLIKVEACGICGSDLHMYRTNAHRDSLVRTTDDGGEIPGHEFSGTIVQTGVDVHDFQIGERVVGVGMGGMAQFVPIPVNPFQLVRIPENVSFEEAATTEPFADGLQMVRIARIQPHENIVVFGVGIIGLGVIQALKAVGTNCGHIIAIDVSDQRLAMAKELGATHLVNPARDDILKTTGRICGRVPAYPSLNPPNISVVFDCAGYLKHMVGPSPLQSALDMAKSGGRIICFGAFEDKVSLDLMPIINKQLSIFGSNGYASEELVQALAFMSSGQVDRRKLISHIFSVDEVAEAFKVQGSGSAIKVLIKPH